MILGHTFYKKCHLIGSAAKSSPSIVNLSMEYFFLYTDTALLFCMVIIES